MTTNAPPWAALATSQPTPFSINMYSDYELVVTTGKGRELAVCRADLLGGRIAQRGAGKLEWVVPYSVCLEEWQSNEPPLLCSHPFLLPHLMITGQVNIDELRNHLNGIGQDVVRWVGAFTAPCALLDMLGLPRMAIRLMTTYGQPAMCS